MQENEMLTDLRASIDKWIAASESRTIASLARKTSLAPSTIRYIVQGERLPTSDVVLSIISAIMTISDRASFCRKHYPSIGEVMDLYSKDMRPEPNDDSLKTFLRKEPHNKIFNMAATSYGVKRSHVIKMAGDMGDQALNEMITEGILIENNETITYSAKSWSLAKSEDLLQQITASTGYFQKDLLNTDGATLAHLTCSVRKEDIPFLKKTVTNFIKNFYSLKDDPSREGDITLFCDIMFSLYDRNQWLED